jgi:hypothetical protein
LEPDLIDLPLENLDELVKLLKLIPIHIEALGKILVGAPGHIISSQSKLRSHIVLILLGLVYQLLGHWDCVRELFKLLYQALSLYENVKEVLHLHEGYLLLNAWFSLHFSFDFKLVL